MFPLGPVIALPACPEQELVELVRVAGTRVVNFPAPSLASDRGVRVFDITQIARPFRE